MEYAKKTGVNKPAAGHLKKSGAEGVKFQREFRLDEGTNGDHEGRATACWWTSSSPRKKWT